MPTSVARSLDARLFGTGQARVRTDTMVTTPIGALPERMAFRNYRFLGEDHEIERTAVLADNFDLQLRLGPLVGAGRGHTVVILGNGPSLNEVDPADLRTVTTIGSNFIHLFDTEGGFLPSIVTCSNLLVIDQGIEVFRGLDTAVLLPSYARELARDDQRMLLANINHDTGFSTDLVDGASTYSTVTFVNLQLAATLGFDRIVLTGFDHSYEQPRAGSHGAVIDQQGDDVNHFSPTYFRGKRWQKADTDEMAKVYVETRSQLPDTAIVNATVGGHLDVFPRQSLEDAIPAESRCLDLDRLRQPRQTPRHVVASVNPNAETDIGHYVRFDQRLRQSLNRRELGFASLGSLALEPELERRYAWLVPTFSGPFTEHHVGDRRIDERMPTFRPELDRGLRMVGRAAEDPDITTFWYMANLEYLTLVPEHGRHFLHLFFSYAYDLDDPAVCRWVGEQLRIADDRGIHVAVPTDAEAAIWSDRLDRPLCSFPSAPSMLFHDGEAPGPRERRGVFFPGTTSRGKGHQDALRFAASWRDPVHPVSVRSEGSITNQPATIHLRGELSHHDMRRHYLDAAAVVLPYRPDPFGRRSSGSFTEAVRAGAPIVACRGTHMGDLIDGHGLGATYEAGDDAALAAAVQATLAENEPVAARVRQFRDDTYARQTSWGAVVDAVLGDS